MECAERVAYCDTHACRPRVPDFPAVGVMSHHGGAGGRSGPPAGYAFELTIVPAGTADGLYGVRLVETPQPTRGRWPVVTATPRQVARVLDALVTAVRASDKPASVLSPARRRPVQLEESAGVRLALVLPTAGPVATGERARRIAAGIGAMSTEETYYWYAKAQGLGAPAVRALRLLTDAA